MKICGVLPSFDVLLETEDLFPGINSSVLDIKPKEKEEDLASLKAQDKKLQIAMNVHNSASDRIFDLLKDKDALDISATPIKNAVPYHSFSWFDKYSRFVPDFVGDSLISKNSPLFKDIEKYIRSIYQHQKRVSEILSKRYVITDEIGKIRKKNKKVRVTAASSTFDAYAKTVTQIPAPNPIPKKLPVKNRSLINNPYVTANASNQYAGHVALYPDWSNYWKDQIVQVNDILKRNGKGELGMMYASTHQNGGGRFNFVITGANGNLTWRKYDPSPGAGQNWLYISGKKINTSALLGVPPATQDKMVAPL